jgi:protein-disulfide isomerase-like protein with CxxC motif
LGVQGFPALLCGEKGRESFLANGYVSFDEIKPRLDSLVLSVKK